MGIPHFCTIVALSKGDYPVLGVTYDPMVDELFSAERGKGAFLNGERISVSERPAVSEALLCCDLGQVNEKAGLAIDMIRSIWPDLLSLRLLGSAGLGVAYAAASRVDMYFHNSLSPWDIVAGLVQVSEAGGQIVDRQGKPANLQTSGIIAANPALIADFLRQTDGLPWRDT
jgi:myo-inositol-1(or 4)-monophosphatase